MAQDVYDLITQDIIDRINKTGRLPWHKPWSGSDSNILPLNAATGRPYSGINVLILWSLGHDDMRFATFKQAQQAGGRVRKGAKGVRVVFWNMIERKDKATGDVDIVPLLRYYTVFHIDDIEGADWKRTEPEPAHGVDNVTEDDDAVSKANALYRNMPNKPTMSLDGGNRAYYMPSTDSIHIPRVENFHTGEGYAETLLHEMVHSTGHSTRLDRHAEDEPCAAFGSPSYSREELVAEIGAAFLMARAGIDNDDTRQNNAAYVKGWAAKLEDDNRAIIYAAARAQKAVNYINTEDTE